MGGRLEVSNLHYEVTPKDLAVRSLVLSTAAIRGTKYRALQSIFGQIGTLVREPVIRVRLAVELSLISKTKFANTIPPALPFT